MTSHPDRFPNERPPTVSKGCWIAGAIALVLILLVVGVGFSFYQMKSVSHAEMVHQMAEAEHRSHMHTSISSEAYSSEKTVVIRQDELANFSATDFGESLSTRNAVAILVDPSSTRLTRDAFTKAADGLEVEWLLKVSEIAPSNEGIRANLLIPYSIDSGHSTQSSYVRVEAMFPKNSYDELVNIRQGQWIPVRGKLKIDGKDLELLDPVLGSKSAESPAH